jgi:1-acyl-sn-glycerol-3-phosphate acyltransferase
LRILRLFRRGSADWDASLRGILRSIYWLVTRILDVRLTIESGSADPADVRASNGLVVLARHCGPGDTVFIAWLLTVHYGLRLHVVLKALLRLEPIIDLAGDRLPLCFVGHGGRRARRRIQRLATTMSRGDALLLFPEGGNFSWNRWRRAILTAAERGELRIVNKLRRRTHTLPPHAGGAGAALAGCPTADVLLLMHTGLAEDGRARPWWRLPVHSELAIRTELVPAGELPQNHDDLKHWLDRAWSRVDAWVTARTPD